MQADTPLAPCPTEREQFEAWVEGPNNRIRRDPRGMYCQSHVQHMWEGWIAARRAQAAPQGPAITTRRLLREFWRGYHVAQEEGQSSDARAALGLRAALIAAKSQ